MRVSVPWGVAEPEARNRALASVTEPYVAFVSNGAAPDGRWLNRPVHLLDEDDHISMVAPSLAGQERVQVAFTGLPYPPSRPPRAPAEDDVLFAPFEACIARTDHLRRVGGYDDRLAGPGADVDLGWRLWLLGGSVRWCPSSVVRPAPGPGADRRRAARNGLAAMYKCYDRERLGTALPAALLCLPQLFSAAGDDPAEARAAIDDFMRLLPELKETRDWVQANRLRPDATILSVFGDPLGQLVTAPAARAVADSLDLPRAFGSRRRILIVSLDVFTHRMAGPAIRAWNIAEALADNHDVCLVTLSQLCTVTSERFDVRAADASQMVELESWAEIVILQGFVFPLAPVLRSTSKVVVVDLYDPLHFETLELAKGDPEERRAARVSAAVDMLNEQLQRGDFFLCASTKQRDLWVGELAALGRINPQTYDEDPTLRALLEVVPFGIPDAEPVHQRRVLRGVVPGIEEDAEILLWGGGIYNWFDPVTLIRAVGALAQRRPKVRLFFMGLTHPNPEVPQMKMAVAARALSDELDLSDRVVFFNEGWVSYDERQNYLLEADIGVSTHFEHAETAYSFRTRILDYMWGWLPIVATAGDSFADLVEAAGLGIVVAPEDQPALESALDLLLSDDDIAKACRANLDRVRASYRWSSVLAPLVHFCRSPRRAPDLVSLEHLRLGERRNRWAHGILAAEMAGAIERLRGGQTARAARRAAERLQARRGDG